VTQINKTTRCSGNILASCLLLFTLKHCRIEVRKEEEEEENSRKRKNRRLIRMIRIKARNYNNKVRTNYASVFHYSTRFISVTLLFMILLKRMSDVSSFQIELHFSISNKYSSSREKIRRSRIFNSSFTRLLSIDNDDNDQFDVSKEQQLQQQQGEKNSRNLVRLEKSTGLLQLAKLSLQDYEWRNGFFKKREANRRMEESLARMMGDEASYVRPMDASESNIGPLGLWEKSSVEWLRQVIEEEARRAREIVRLGGILVRPMDAYCDGDEQSLGPLGIVERRVVDFLDSIRDSERERSNLKVLRPKDLEPSLRGPLGEAELRASEAIREIIGSEKMRMQQSKIREGIVRPIDVPGPLGDLEMAVLDVVKAEEQRKLESEQTDGALIRPMNARKKGPLGELEEQAIEAVRRLTDEEKVRLRNIQRFLDENRPMEQVEPSALGVVETIVVGIIRAPILIFQILSRVRDLLQSEPLDNVDVKILKDEEKTGKKNEK